MNDLWGKRKERTCIGLLIFGVIVFVISKVFHDELYDLFEKSGYGDKVMKYLPLVGIGIIVIGVLFAIPFIIRRVKIARFMASGKYVYATFDHVDRFDRERPNYDREKDGPQYRYISEFSVLFTYMNEQGQIMRFCKEYEDYAYIPFHEGDQARVYVDPSKSSTYYVSEKHIQHPANYQASAYRKSVVVHLILAILFGGVTAVLAKYTYDFIKDKNTIALLIGFVTFVTLLITCAAIDKLKKNIGYNIKVS